MYMLLFPLLQKKRKIKSVCIVGTIEGDPYDPHLSPTLGLSCLTPAETGVTCQVTILKNQFLKVYFSTLSTKQHN